MPRGEMQLIAYGSQDIYLTGNPSITFFKFVYKKHTNFASEYIRQDFITLPSYNTNSRSQLKCKIDRNGDLIHDIYLVYDLPDIFSGPESKINELGIPVSEDTTRVGEYFRWIDNLGENIIHTVEILLDGQVLDKQYGLWLNIWNELTIPKSKRHAYDTLIGNISSCNNPSIYNGNYEGKPSETNNLPTIPSRRLYIPLPFWFCKNPGLAIPLIALQYNELFINIEFNQLNDLYTVGNPPIAPNKIFDENYLNNFGNNSYSETSGLGTNPITDNNLNLKKQLNDDGFSKFDLFWKFINNTNSNSSSWSQQAYLDVNYIFLDTDERTKYAQINHEYLITQVQTSHFILNNVNESLKGSVNILNLLFQHPVKELIWVLRRNDVDNRNQWNNYTTGLYDFDYNDSQNNYSKDFVNPNTLGLSRSLFHINKNISTSNYIRGISNGFDETGSRADTCMDGSLDANDYHYRNSDSFNQVNNIMYNAKLVFNGNDRFATKDNVFFNYLQPFKYHTSTPSPGVNVFSFALNPEDDQPSGTCNMSRIDLVQLEVSLRWLFHKSGVNCDNVDLNEGYELFIFGVNYNVLRILGGMGGLVFSN
jgi:hypothetical protein